MHTFLCVAYKNGLLVKTQKGQPLSHSLLNPKVLLLYYSVVIAINMHCYLLVSYPRIYKRSVRDGMPCVRRTYTVLQRTGRWFIYDTGMLLPVYYISSDIFPLVDS